MPFRTLNLSLTALTLLGIGVPIIDQPSVPTTLLRVESLSRLPIHVRLTMKVERLAGTPTAPRTVRDSVFRPPLSMEIGDSIRTIHLVVKELGSIRAELHNDAAPDASPVVAEGRDVTLVGDGHGHFKRVWRAQPLVP